MVLPKTVEQINDYLFIDTNKSNKIKIGMNEIRANDSEMSMRWNNKVWSVPEIYQSWDSLCEYKLGMKRTVDCERDGF